MFDFLKNKFTGPKEKVTAIVVAAGQGLRMGGINKQLVEVFDRPLIAYTLDALEQSRYIDEIVVVTREEDIVTISDITAEFGITKATDIIAGGSTRSRSVEIGLSCARDADMVVIHDGARPCILTADVDRVIEAAEDNGCAALGCPVNDTLKHVNGDGMIIGTVDRSGLWQVQTPQVFRRDIIEAAYSGAGAEATDDCALVEKVGGRIIMVEGPSSNIKVTRNDDVYIAMAILQSRLDEDF